MLEVSLPAAMAADDADLAEVSAEASEWTWTLESRTAPTSPSPENCLRKRIIGKTSSKVRLKTRFEGKTSSVSVKGSKAGKVQS